MAVTNEPAGLIQVLLDEDAEFGDRDDAAMDLSAYDDDAVEKALARVACDIAADADLADTCGESLAEIWCRKERIPENILVRLTPVSLRIALGTMEALCPALVLSANEMLRAER